MLTTRVLLTEDRLVQDFVAALARRELPERYFYWFPTSVRAWLNLCGDGAYRNYVWSRALLEAHAADVASRLPTGDRKGSARRRGLVKRSDDSVVAYRLASPTPPIR